MPTEEPTPSSADAGTELSHATASLRRAGRERMQVKKVLDSAISPAMEQMRQVIDRNASLMAASVTSPAMEQMRQVIDRNASLMAASVTSPAMEQMRRQMDQHSSLMATVTSPAMEQMRRQAERMSTNLVSQLRLVAEQQNQTAGTPTTSVLPAQPTDWWLQVEVLADVVAALTFLWLFTFCLSEMNRTTEPMQVPDLMQTLQTITWCLGALVQVRLYAGRSRSEVRSGGGSS